MVYKTSYDHLTEERLDPANIDKADGRLLTALTNWRPTSEPAIEYTGSNFETVPDRIDYVMSTMMWKDVSTQINIGVHLADGQEEPVEFSIKVSDFANSEIYPEEVKL